MSYSKPSSISALIVTLSNVFPETVAEVGFAISPITSLTSYSASAV